MKNKFFSGIKHFSRLLPCSRNFALIPVVLDRNGASERAYDIYSRLLKDRIICLMGGINDEIASVTIAQLLFLQSEDKKAPINIYINSPGGVVTSGLAIYDTIQYISPPVATWCVGQASSMGSLLLCAGSSGYRYALPHSRIMVHQPSGSAYGPATDISIQADEIIKMKKILKDIYIKHTNQNEKVVDKWFDRDSFLSAKEAVDYGIIDKVLEKKN